jgi:hypothetical protein
MMPLIRAKRGLLIASMLWLSWLVMMLVHEGGHVFGAVMTGGVVQQVVWHPAVLSRTDVSPNPNPLLEVLAGPVIGSALPLATAAIVWSLRLKAAYLLWFTAGFCLIANGAYLGVGAIDPVGDAEQLLALGVPRWVLGAIGLTITIAGFVILHRVSPNFGFGKSPMPIDGRYAWGVTAVAFAVTLVGLFFGNPGR